MRRGITDTLEIYLAHSQEPCEWTVYKTFADFIDSNLTYGTMVFAEGMMDILTLATNGRIKGASWSEPPPPPNAPPPLTYGRAVVTKADKADYAKWRSLHFPQGLPAPPPPLSPYLGQKRVDPTELLRVMDTRAVFKLSACWVKG